MARVRRPPARPRPLSHRREGSIAATKKKPKRPGKLASRRTAHPWQTDERLDEALTAIADSVAMLHAASTDAETCQMQIERLLAAQQRTNRLLELALAAGFEDEEQLRRQ